MSAVAEVFGEADFREPRRVEADGVLALAFRERHISVGEDEAIWRGSGAAAAGPVTVELVALNPDSGRHIALPLTLRREQRGGVGHARGTDASGLIDVELSFDAAEHRMSLHLATGDLGGRPLADVMPAIRFLRWLASPIRFGVMAPGGVPFADHLEEVPDADPPIADDLAEAFEALLRVVTALGLKQFRAPPELFPSTRDEIHKADRLLAGDVVHHSWTHMTGLVEAGAIRELLEDVLQEQASIDFRSSFRFMVGSEELALNDRWVRVHSAVVANRHEALSFADHPQGSHFALRLTPGGFKGAESKLGEFPPHGAAGPHSGREADALGPHAGRWVATKGLEVVAHGDSLDEVLENVRARKIKPDAVQKVPTRGDVEVGGSR